MRPGSGLYLLTPITTASNAPEPSSLPLIVTGLGRCYVDLPLARQAPTLICVVGGSAELSGDTHSHGGYRRKS